MNLGPVELLAVAFPGNQFKGQIAPALHEIVDKGLIRVIDFVFVCKGVDGTVTAVEFQDLGDETVDSFDPLIDSISGLLSEQDIQDVARALDNNSSAALLLFEHVWATRFRDAIVNANGKLLASERIPAPLLEQALLAKKAS